MDSLLKFWEGLGYYNRCKNFHKAVNIIVKNYYSTLPKKIEEFKSLPGVGEYTAAAVYSISFSENYPVLDGNVKRVMCRMLGVRHFTSFNKKKILSKINVTMIHGQKDEVVPVSYSKKVLKIFKNAKKKLFVITKTVLSNSLRKYFYNLKEWNLFVFLVTLE